MSFEIINPFQTFWDSSGIVRSGGFVTFFVNRTTTKGFIFSDEALSIGQSNPYELNANGQIEGDVKFSGLRTIQVTNFDGSDVRTTDDVATIGDLTKIENVSVTGTDTIVATGSPTVTTLVDLTVFNFIAAGTITTSPTFQVDATAVKNVRKFHDHALVAGDWESGQAVSLMYNLTDDVYELMSNTAAHNFPTDVNTDGTFNPLGDTAAADLAAVGYATASGLQLTGQGSVNDVTIRNDANATALRVPTGTTNIDIAGNLSVSGGQIAFPATQIPSADANTLDDYEEGEFQVTFTAATGTITVAVSADTLAYTKIGRVCHVQGFINISSVSSPTGLVTMSGLPFTSGNTTESSNIIYFPIWARDFNARADGFQKGVITSTVTTVVIDGAETANIGAEVIAGTEFAFDFSYITA